MSRYLGEHVAIVRLDERLRYAGRTLAYTSAIAPLDDAVLVFTSGSDAFSLNGRSHRPDSGGFTVRGMLSV